MSSLNMDRKKTHKSQNSFIYKKETHDNANIQLKLHSSLLQALFSPEVDAEHGRDQFGPQVGVLLRQKTHCSAHLGGFLRGAHAGGTRAEAPHGSQGTHYGGKDWYLVQFLIKKVFQFKGI